MKRWVVLGALIVCGLGVFFLLQESTTQRSSRRTLDAEDGGGAAGTPNGAGGGETGDTAGGASGPGAGGATTDDDPNRIPGPPVTITGLVVRDGHPVSGAGIAIEREHPKNEPYMRRWERSLTDDDYVYPSIAEATTDATGHFRVTIARRSRLVVEARHQGSATARRRLLVPATGDPDEVLIELRDGCSLRGRVVDPKDKPVGKASVVLRTNNWRSPPVNVTTETDERGEFRFDDLGDGYTTVRVRVEGYPQLTQTAQLPETSTLLFRLLEPGVIVGKVTDDAGRPVAGATLVVSSGDRPVTGRSQAETDEAGAYRIEAAQPGPLTSATLLHPEYGMRSLYREDFTLPTDLVEPGKELHWDIRLEHGVVVRGRVVRAETEQGVAGAKVTLLRMQRLYRGMNEVDAVASGEDGRFEFHNVREGTYALEAMHELGARRAVRYAQQQKSLTIDFFVDATTPPGEQRIEIIPTGDVRGRVLDVSPLSYPQMGIQMQIDTGSIQAYVDDFGNFEIEHAPVMEGAILQSWNPQLKSEPFAVKAGETTTIDLHGAANGGFTGIVEDEQGNPIEGALVQAMPKTYSQQGQNLLQGGGWNAVRTDADGRFLATIQEWFRQQGSQGLWMVMAVHRDYALTTVTDLELPPEGETKEVRLVLRGGGIVAGRVESAAGAPVHNATVHLTPKRVKEVRFDTRQPRQARTDFDGRFTIRGVADGKYTLTVDHTDGVADPIDDLEAGTEGLRVVLRATMSIRGVILDEDDLPVSGAQVNAIVPTAKGETKTGGTLGGSGRFQIDHLEPGSYAIEVSPSNQGWQATSGFETLRIPPVPAGSDNVVIRVSSGATVAGRVLSESGGPIAGAGVIALPKQLKPQERRNPYQTSRPAAITNGRGEFELKGVGSEPIEVIALAVGYQPGTEEVSPGGGAVTLRLEKGARIEGKVLLPDGKPLVGQWIWAQAAAGDLQNKFNGWQQRGGQTWNNFGGWQIFGTNTNSRGEFQLLSLLPGEYTLQINSAEGVAAEATYRTGSGDITIQLVSPLTIRGKVVDAAGNPIVPDGNYQVYINARRGSRYFSSATAASDGSFELKGLAPGKVTLNVWAGQRYKPATVDVEAGEQSLVISLEENKPSQPAEKK